MKIFKVLFSGFFFGLFFFPFAGWMSTYLSMFILSWRGMELQHGRIRFLTSLKKILLKIIYPACTILFLIVLELFHCSFLEIKCYYKKWMPWEKYNRKPETKAFDLLCIGHWLKFDLGKQLISIIIRWLIWPGWGTNTSHAKKSMKMDSNWHYCIYSQENTWSLGRDWTVNSLAIPTDSHWRGRQENSNATAWESLHCWCPCCTCSVDKQTISFPRAVSIWHLSSEWNSLQKKEKKESSVMVIAQLRLFIQCSTEPWRVMCFDKIQLMK